MWYEVGLVYTLWVSSWDIRGWTGVSVFACGQYKTWTADYGLGIKRGLENMGGYKRRTRCKTRTADCGLSIKYRLRTR